MPELRKKRRMERNTSRVSLKRWVAASCMAIALCAGTAETATSAVTQTAATVPLRLDLPIRQLGLVAAAAGAPGILGRVHRATTRSERALRRLTATLGLAVVTWFWVLLSALGFLIVAALASAIDLRMLDFRRQSAQVLGRDLGHGVRMFFRILRDGRTPYLPRALLVAALLYWLLPVDFVGDSIPVLGMLDDLVIAIVAAKLFIHLCPDAVVEAHATALRANA
jgi:uncharacterized membrane protein YkvA (DUF1232 family)